VSKTRVPRRALMSGNDAVAEGALRAGVDCFFGYPITPQSEIMYALARRMPKLRRAFLQSESELAAISMVHGAAAAGARAMTSSSSPGISLMQEGISYLAGCRLPAVIVNVQRGSPGLGNIGGAQGDYWQATRGGGHGDYRTPVLAPCSVQEMMDFTFEAFDLADQYRTPVMVLSDGQLAQMHEPVDLRDPPRRKLMKKTWALDGANGRPPNCVKSLYLPLDVLSAHNDTLQATYRQIERAEQRCETYRTTGAELVLVAYGTCARVCRAAVDALRDAGQKVGLLRPITLWPFPNRRLAAAARTAGAFLVVEMSAGQMVEDVQLATQCRRPVQLLGRTGGNVPTVKEVAAAARKALRTSALRRKPKGAGR